MTAVFCAGAIAAGATPAAASAAPDNGVYHYARHYIPGQTAGYTYTEQVNGTTDTTAVARQTSYVNNGVGGDQIQWTSLEAGGQDLDSEAQAFPAYDLSLDPKAADGLSLPSTQDAPDLHGPVTDLETFYVALSGKTGIGNADRVGQSYADPNLLSGDFSTAADPVGQDLTQLTTTLTSLSAHQATFTSTFEPPVQGGLTMTASFMNAPVCGSTPNNFELVEGTGSAYIALWGCEQFTTTTTVNRATGAILSAQMANPLQLDYTSCQDAALTECQPTEPVTQLRSVQLTRN